MSKPKTYRPSPAAAAALARLTAKGQSENSVINDLLEDAGRAQLPTRVMELEEWRAQVEARLDALEKR